MRKKKPIFILFSTVWFAALAIISVHTTYAYLSADMKPLTNVITAGSVEIALEEKNWDSRKAKALQPGQSIPKDPVVRNTGENSAWVFLEVTVPVRTISVVDENRKKTEPKRVPLFSYKADETAWELIEEEYGDEAQRCIYGYKKLLKPGQKTEPLFTSAALLNYLEGELLPEECFDILVSAAAIQENVAQEKLGLRQVYSEFLGQKNAEHYGLL